MKKFALATLLFAAGLPAMAQSMTLPVVEKTNGAGHQIKAVNMLRQGQSDEALKEALTALEEAKALDQKVPENQQILASCYSLMGKVFRRMNRYDESLDAYQHALDYWKSQRTKAEPNGSELEGMLLNNMGEQYKAMGKLDKALPTLLEAKAAMKEDGTNYSTIVENLGTVYFLQKNFPEAESNWKKAIETARRDNDKRSAAESMCGLAMLYAKQGRNDDAKKASEDAIAFLNSAFGANDPRISLLKKLADRSAASQTDFGDDAGSQWMKNIQAGTAAMNSGNLPLAVSSFESALEIVDKTQPDSRVAAATLSPLAAAYLKSNQLKKAEATMTRALPLCKKYFADQPKLIESLESGLTAIKAKAVQQ